MSLSILTKKLDPDLIAYLAKTRPISPHLQVSAQERKALVLVAKWEDNGGYSPQNLKPIDEDIYPIYRRGLITRTCQSRPDAKTLFVYHVTERGAECLACFGDTLE